MSPDIEYQLSGGGTQLYAVPILVTNYIDGSGNKPNTGMYRTSQLWERSDIYILITLI